MSKERTAEEWGRVAVSLPGWRWMPGMLVPHRGYGRLDDDDVSDHPLYRLPMRDDANAWPDPDDPATVGCLLALLEGALVTTQGPLTGGGWIVHTAGASGPVFGRGSTLGRACIAAAAALGRWPGGEG